MSYPPLIGLTGPARSGKNTVADHLCARYGYTRMAFSDALYEEVSDAFRVPQTFLRGDDTKDVKSYSLSMAHCRDPAFVNVAIAEIGKIYMAPPCPGVLLLPWREELSPRQVLQWWGTEYRRAQDPDYWVKKLAGRYAQHLSAPAYYLPLPGLESRVVVDGVRYPNEVTWLRACPGSELWHLKRDVQAVSTHSSETPVKWERLDSVIRNDGTIAELEQRVDKMLTHREKR